MSQSSVRLIAVHTVEIVVLLIFLSNFPNLDLLILHIRDEQFEKATPDLIYILSSILCCISYRFFFQFIGYF